jgi:hypothetical protein
MARQHVQLVSDVNLLIREGRERATRSPKKRRPRVYERCQVNLRLAPEIDRILKAVALVEGTSPAGVADLFISEALRLYLDGKIEFDQHTEESRSPRYDWVVQVAGLGALERELEDFTRR